MRSALSPSPMRRDCPPASSKPMTFMPPLAHPTHIDDLDRAAIGGRCDRRRDPVRHLQSPARDESLPKGEK
jgi:hypothetical protein